MRDEEWWGVRKESKRKEAERASGNPETKRACSQNSCSYVEVRGYGKGSPALSWRV